MKKCASNACNNSFLCKKLLKIFFRTFSVTETTEPTPLAFLNNIFQNDMNWANTSILMAWNGPIKMEE
ncbi:MAG: hypothetical protein HMLIMOIP_002157 [Candidatus Nitrosomirales archaeon]|jgi:hypothetical protein